MKFLGSSNQRKTDATINNGCSEHGLVDKVAMGLEKKR
jgi:hypothetical protein